MEQYLALKASAGSGKTFALSLRFLYLLFCGANPNEILTLTFTNKASAEMKHRIYDNLAKLCADIRANAFLQNDIFKELVESGLKKEHILSNAKNLYDKLMQSNPKISTYDSFFHLILKRFCWYVGVPHSFKNAKIEDASVKEYFFANLESKQLDNIITFCLESNSSMNDFFALLALLDNSFIESSVITHIKAELDSSDICIDSDIFSQIKSIKQSIQNNFLQIFKIMENDESIQARVKEKFSEFAMNLSDAKSLIKFNLLHKWQEHSWLKKSDLSTMDSYRATILNLAKKLLLLEQYVIFKQMKSYIELFKKARQQALKAQNIMDFNAVTAKVNTLLNKHYDKDFFAFRLDSRISHILLDEFQDTSIIQYAILQPFLNEILSGVGRIENRSIFIVGDEKQSIYSFRGSFVKVFEVASKNLKQDSLAYNYRSAKEVIEFNNFLFKDKYTNYINQLPSEKNAPQGGIKILLDIKKENLLQEVLNHINDLLSMGANINDIAILSFDNDAAMQVGEYLRERGILCVMDTTSNLFDTSEAHIILDSLNFIESSNQAYLHLIAKTLGKALDDIGYIRQILLNFKKQNLSLQKLILEIIKSFDISNLTTNAILEISCEYASISQMLKDLPYRTDEAAMRQSNGIKILTIHKSKGLEFQHTILLDKLKDDPHDKSKFIMDYDDNLRISHIYKKISNISGEESNLNNIYPPYLQTLQAHKQRLEDEGINVLYVAFTRAKQSLCVIAKDKKSRFEKLNLSPQKTGIFENNKNIGNAIQKAESKQLPSIIELQHFGVQNDFIKKQAKQQILDKAQWESIIFGEALHSVFELHLGYKMSKENIKFALQNAYGFYCDNLDFILNAAFKAIKSSEFSKLLSNKQILCEVGYIKEDKMQRIDTLLIGKDECVVLDYKSSTKHQETQIEQVKNYMNFISSLYPHKQISGFIIYPLNKNNMLYRI